MLLRYCLAAAPLLLCCCFIRLHCSWLPGTDETTNFLERIGLFPRGISL